MLAKKTQNWESALARPSFNYEDTYCSYCPQYFRTINNVVVILFFTVGKPLVSTCLAWRTCITSKYVMEHLSHSRGYTLKHAQIPAHISHPRGASLSSKRDLLLVASTRPPLWNWSINGPIVTSASISREDVTLPSLIIEQRIYNDRCVCEFFLEHTRVPRTVEERAYRCMLQP